MTFTVEASDAQLVTAIFAGLAALLTAWNAVVLSRVHRLTNSNYTEAKSARDAAQAALETSRTINRTLETQLAARRRDEHTAAANHIPRTNG